MQLKEWQPIIVVQSAKQSSAGRCHGRFNEWLQLAAQDVQLSHWMWLGSLVPKNEKNIHRETNSKTVSLLSV